jgi:hypothetical protein
MIKISRKLYKYIRISLAIYLIVLLIILLSSSFWDIPTMKYFDKISNGSIIFTIIFFYIFKEKED